MSGISVSSAGIKIAYAVETAAGTMPTAATQIHDIRSIPDFNPAPEQLETTDLSCTEYKTFIPGLKDLSGSNSFTANLTQTLITAWDALMTAFTEGKAANKKTWFFIVIPNYTECVAFTGEPTAMGLPAAEVSAVLETSLYITPTGEPTWTSDIPTIT